MKEISQFCGGSRLAGALKAYHHVSREASFGGKGQLAIVASEEGRDFVMADFDELLARRDGPGDLAPEGLFLHVGKESLDDLEIDVAFQKRHLDFPEGFLHVFLGQAVFLPHFLMAPILLSELMIRATVMVWTPR